MFLLFHLILCRLIDYDRTKKISLLAPLNIHSHFFLSDRSWPKRCRRIRKWSSHENAQKCSNRVGFCSDEIRHKTQWNCKETFLTPVWDLFLHRLNEIDSLLTFLSWLFDLNGTVLISKLLIAFFALNFPFIRSFMWS